LLLVAREYRPECREDTIIDMYETVPSFTVGGEDWIIELASYNDFVKIRHLRPL